MLVLIIVTIVICIIFYLCMNYTQNDKFKINNFVEEFASTTNMFEKESFFDFFKQSEPKKSNISVKYNGKTWIVQQPDSTQMLEQLITRINKLIDNIKDNPEHTYSLKRLKYWDNTFVFENIKESWKNDSTSYSINKGEELVFCIRDKINNSIHDINTLMFVAIHELAHIITDELQHTQKFWNNMKSLLKRAELLGLYQNVDYSINPVEYCGMTINSSP